MSSFPLAALNWSWSIDGWIIVTGVLCAVASSLLGVFLVLRRMSMLGDAIAHAVLPGLAVAFLLTHSRSGPPMLVGAVVVGLLTALFTEWIRHVGQVDEGASMGVVFTSMFALGLVLIVQAADHVDLDAGCVLHGAVEQAPFDTVTLAGWTVPRAAALLATILLVNLAFVAVFFKELKITAFDPALATTLGIHARLMHYLLMVLVAVTAVASFETVGNILVVAMFVAPPAAAYMLTDRLGTMIAGGAALAAIAAAAGHVGAIIVPAWFGYHSTSTAGMMAVAAGAILFTAVLLGPRHGVLVKLLRRRLLSWHILADDIVALLYRIEERGGATPATVDNLRGILLADRASLRLLVAWLRLTGKIRAERRVFRLTTAGQQVARGLVRSHRLWEQYLVSHVGVAAARLHEKAEQFEHFTDPDLRAQLARATSEAAVDPHGSPIPAERPPSSAAPSSPEGSGRPHAGP